MNQRNGTLKGLELRCDQTMRVPEDGSCPSGTSEEAGSEGSQHDNGSCASNKGHACETRQSGDFESQRGSKGTEEIRANLKEGGEKRGRYILGVAVCILGAITSSLLQFVFVYGEICFRALKNTTRTDGSLFLAKVVPEFSGVFMFTTVCLADDDVDATPEIWLSSHVSDGVAFPSRGSAGCAQPSISPKKARGLLSSVGTM